ncbi:MAG: hypothetical protein ACYC35_16855 [Pirellulales bacterium]
MGPETAQRVRITSFEDSGVCYKLAEPLLIEIEFSDGLWVYHHEPLNLWGYGETPEKALGDLHANFGYLWREFAEEDDSVLDDKAKHLKQLLLSVAEKCPAGA